MTRFFETTARRLGALPPTWLRGLLLLVPLSYLATLARTIVVGDPTEYTFVAHVLGVAHPPGYALITLLGKLFQTVIPLGSVAWRMHLLAATAATAAVAAVHGTVQTVAGGRGWSAAWAALLGALTVGWGADFWQHASHANPHIITAAFLAFNLLALVRWGVGDSAESAPNRWLYAFALSAGLGVTHHPLTVFAFPAYGGYILAVWWRRTGWGGWRQHAATLARMVGAALLGLLPWLYFPLRAPALVGSRFPADMNTLDGFLNLTLARGLRVNLFAFGWAEQFDRALVFWSLLRLQYSLPVIFVAAVGLGRLLRRPATRPTAGLIGGALLLNYAFVINTVQDVMAYLLGPFLIIGLLAGVGTAVLHRATVRRLGSARLGGLLLAALLLLGPALQLARNGPRVSLRAYDEGVATIAAVFDWFGGRGEGAVLLNDWEHMTPLWYADLVEGRQPDAGDVRPIFVSSAKPWLDHVFEQLPGGPVYLNRFERSVFDAGFRLRARGPFWQVVEPGSAELPPELTPVAAAGGDLELVGYDLPQRAVTAGDWVPLALALRAPAGTANFYVPVVRVGPLTLPFTTDSHLLTPDYRPGEIIVERFDFALPHDLAGGSYPVTVGLQQLNGDIDTGLRLDLGEVTVTAQPFPRPTDHLLGNFRQRVGLAGAVARHDGRHRAPWAEPITARSGDVVHLTVQWEVIAPPEDSYTVFVHVIDLGNRPIIDNLDYTPLGGAAPSHLWFPKWLPGQRLLDPYRIDLTGVPPGDYLIEVGLYEQFTKRRLHLSDRDGNLVGDRVILGGLRVTE